ncbi:beige/beach-related [Anaeramoeba flamelloides]|uniref:Beige/beach-related n=1 Tax=Anaeramoeba flamelloides TaxID=1746091 RepID=A0AAV7YHX4_9EUKA|nr:beige/beach-related [Anaeramoeba flamelloides]
MYLNTIAGRSFNDLTQYPVFPWIITDCKSENLDLTNPSIYRDLSKPMGAQTKERLESFRNTYKNWSDPNIPSFYYGSHYSCSGIILHYLCRTEPFAKNYIDFQSGKFDNPNRLFRSYQLSWENSSFRIENNVKELIPEFFYLPNFLRNENHFNLGINNKQEKVDHVKLPRWANNDAYEFIRINRAALESEYISKHLNEWIDLIFGYKSRGDEAAEAENVFYYLTYVDRLNFKLLTDPKQLKLIYSQIDGFGQCPTQLFKKPHPKKMAFSIIQKKRKLNIFNLLTRLKFKKYCKSQNYNGITLIENKEISIEKIIFSYKNTQLIPPKYSTYLDWNYPDESIRILRKNDSKLISIYEKPHYGKITSLSISKYGKYVITAGQDLVIKLWYLQSKKRKVDKCNYWNYSNIKLLEQFSGHSKIITSMDICLNYCIFVTVSQDKKCLIWDLNKKRLIRKIDNFKNPLTIVKINQVNGDILCCEANRMKLFTLNGELLAQKKFKNYKKDSISSALIARIDKLQDNFAYVVGHVSGYLSFYRLIKNSNQNIKFSFHKVYASNQFFANPIRHLTISKNSQNLYFENGQFICLLTCAEIKNKINNYEPISCTRCSRILNFPSQFLSCSVCKRPMCTNCSVFRKSITASSSSSLPNNNNNLLCVQCNLNIKQNIINNNNK